MNNKELVDFISYKYELPISYKHIDDPTGWPETEVSVFNSMADDFFSGYSQPSNESHEAFLYSLNKKGLLFQTTQDGKMAISEAFITAESYDKFHLLIDMLSDAGISDLSISHPDSNETVFHQLAVQPGGEKCIDLLRMMNVSAYSLQASSLNKVLDSPLVKALAYENFHAAKSIYELTQQLPDHRRTQSLPLVARRWVTSLRMKNSIRHNMSLRPVKNRSL